MFTTATPLNMQDHGAERVQGALSGVLAALHAILAHLPADLAGIRIRGVPGLASLLGSRDAIGGIAARTLGLSCRPVRAVLFDKTERTNWSLAWHQDRTICVEQRMEVSGFGPWTMKDGMQHVAPPFDLLSRMVTLRVHLDDVPATNAPLLIAPGSHKHGRVPVGAIDRVVRECGSYACLADAGDVWAYSTPILHASE
ncbi:MAG TPA: phytanoyl-CoA dioxygenase family protein, partial [Sphingomonas sp.]|nr:phytanoyl-CoA dioxygenase family protein [Sphingomonas sp.]